MKPAGRIEPQAWMRAPETRAVLDALGAEGAELRFVGGCVRDALAGRPVKDVDIATPDPPERVMDLLARAGIKCVATGLDHGTVTAVSGGRPFEITTLRVDVETYGRHARVAFTDDWLADAARRDLTINALACAPDGTLYDPFGGIEDLRAGRVRFVGDPRARIREDTLRLLRFFRFHAHYGRGAPDPEGLAAAAELAPEAANLSGERVRHELLLLLAAPDPVAVIEVMLAHDILAPFLPEAREAGALAALVREAPAGAEDGAEDADPLPRLAALLPAEAGVAERVSRRLRLSRRERARLAAMLAPTPGEVPPVRAEMDGPALRRALYRLGAEAVRARLRLEWARRPAKGRAESRDALAATLEAAATWPVPRFPLKGRDAVALGVPKGPAVGELLDAVERWWIAADFAPDRQACLARLTALAGKGE